MNVEDALTKLGESTSEAVASVMQTYAGEAAQPGPIAILAGSDQLPVLLSDRLRRDGREHKILAFRGFAAP